MQASNSSMPALYKSLYFEKPGKRVKWIEMWAILDKRFIVD
jgi:hypothetical protein